MQPGDASPAPLPGQPRRRRFRAGLLVGYLVITLALVVASVAIYRHHLQVEADESHRELSSIAQLVSDELGGWLEERREDAAYFSDPIIAGPLAEVVADRADEATLERLRASLDRLRLRHAAAALFLIDPHGAVRLSFPDPGAEPSDATTAVADSAVRSGEVAVSELPRVLEIAGPVLAQEGEEGDASVVGAIVVRYEIARVLGPILATWSHDSQTGRVLLLWQEGDAWAWLDGRTAEIATSRSAGAAAPLDLARAFEQPAGVVWQQGSGAGARVALWREAHGTPWRVVVEMDKGEAEDGTGAVSLYLLALALTLALGGVVALNLWSTRGDLAIERQLRAEREASGAERR